MSPKRKPGPSFRKGAGSVSVEKKGDLGVNKFIFIFLSNIKEGGENGRKRFLIDTIWGKGLINFL